MLDFLILDSFNISFVVVTMLCYLYIIILVNGTS